MTWHTQLKTYWVYKRPTSKLEYGERNPGHSHETVFTFALVQNRLYTRLQALEERMFGGFCWRSRAYCSTVVTTGLRGFDCHCTSTHTNKKKSIIKTSATWKYMYIHTLKLYTNFWTKQRAPQPLPRSNLTPIATRNTPVSWAPHSVKTFFIYITLVFPLHTFTGLTCLALPQASNGFTALVLFQDR